MVVKEYSTDVHGKKLKSKIKMDSRLVDEIDILPEWIAANWDAWGIIVGQSGAGKTYAAMRIATRLNANFSLKDIVFSVDQLEEWVEKSSVGDVVLFDESDEIAEHGSSSVVRAFKRYAKRIRTKRLIILLATPTLRDINNYFIGRSRFILYTYARSIKERGYYHYFTTEEEVAWLYWKVKENKVEIRKVYDDAFSTIMNGYSGLGDSEPFHIDNDAYETKKDLATREVLKEGVISQSDKRAVRRKILGIYAKSEKLQAKVSHEDLSALFSVARQYISKEISDIRQQKL